MLSSLSLSLSLLLSHARHTQATALFFWGFSISHIANIFYVFLASSHLHLGLANSPVPSFTSFSSLSLLLLLLLFFCAIFYMQIEFSSILIGFLIGYTCVYIRTTRWIYRCSQPLNIVRLVSSVFVRYSSLLVRG